MQPSGRDLPITEQEIQRQAGRLRAHVRRFNRTLAAYVETQEGVEHFGVYNLGPDERMEGSELLAFLTLARDQHPHQKIVITVDAHPAPGDLSQPTEAQTQGAATA